MTEHPLPTQALPPSAAEDLEDLKARVQQLTARLERVEEQPTQEIPPTPAAAAESEPEETQEETGEEEEAQYPPFILLLDGEEADTELRGLIEWVEGVLVPGYLAEASADARWCHLWFEHPVAVARLHALWLAWQELTDPASCGYTGPSVWHRDHYDPCMRELRASRGPFEGCTKGEHTIAHRMPLLVPSAWYREGDTA